MSKNIIIQEGGAPFQFSVDKLETAKVGGGSLNWVPEEDTLLGTKTITKDGTYKASDEGLYGYSGVTVRGIGTATGKDGDGDDAKVTTDPTTGDLVQTKIPSAIEITTPPTKLNYTDGETINFSGLVVKAKLRTGGIFTDDAYPDGVIPNSELDFPVTTADAQATRRFTTPADDSSATYRNTGETFTFQEVLVGQDFYGNLYNQYLDMWRTYTLTSASASVYAVRKAGSSYDYIYLASSEKFTLHYRGPDSSQPSANVTESDIVRNVVAGRAYWDIQATPNKNPIIAADLSSFAWVYEDMVKFGDGSGEPTNAIPVNWISPYNSATLTDEFTIRIVDGGGGTTEGGGGAGRND